MSKFGGGHGLIFLFFLQFCLGDDLLHHVGRHQVVVAEVHGEAALPPLPVTQRKDTVPAEAPVTKDIDLKGLITVVDLKNSMASISLGEADGVAEGMRFHVTRGDEFICDILIIDTDTEQAVGVLELIQQQPKVGDSVTTRLL